MKLLLDTHTFIWWDSEPDHLSEKVLSLCKNPTNVMLLSVVSVWEIQIKLQLGKLKLTMPLSQLIEGQQKTNDLHILPVLLEHVLAIQDLPLHHKDPFDRILIAQANIEGAALLSQDANFGNYPVNLVW